jgi:hypothetical protein
VQPAEELHCHYLLPFIRTEDGTAPGEAQECQSEGTAIRRAEEMSRDPANAGAVAFKRRAGLSPSQSSAVVFAARPRGSNKPLPQIDGQLVADCKAQNPNFGQRTTLPSQATEPSARVSPLPQAASPQLAPAGQRNGPPSESVEPPMQAVPPQPPATPQWRPCRRLVTLASAKSK